MKLRKIAVVLLLSIITMSVNGVFAATSPAPIDVPDASVTLKYIDYTMEEVSTTFPYELKRINGVTFIDTRIFDKLDNIEGYNRFDYEYDDKLIDVKLSTGARVRNQVGSMDYVKIGADKKEFKGKFQESSFLQDYGIYIPIDIFPILGVTIDFRSDGGQNTLTIDLSNRTSFLNDGAALHSLLFDSVKLDQSFKPDTYDYKAVTAPSALLGMTVQTEQPNVKVTVNGNTFANGQQGTVPTRDLDMLTITTQAMYSQDTRTYRIRLRDSLSLKGKAMFVNDTQPVDTGDVPRSLEGVWYVPVKPVLDALEYKWTLKDDQSFEVERFGSPIVLKTVTVSNTRMASVDDLKSLLIGVHVEDVPPYAIRERLSEENSIRAAYRSATAAYQKAKDAVAKADSSYQKSFYSEPVFIISGEIKSRDPLYLWGFSFSTNAPKDHAGWTGANSTNILIQNPDSSKIAYGQYVNGLHYYKGRTTAKGIFGQTVPVFIFGGPSASTAKKIAKAKTALTVAKAAQEKSRKASNDARAKLIKLVKDKYGNQVKSNPKNYKAYLDFAIALADTSAVLGGDDELMKLADRQAAQAGELQPGSDSYFKLYAAGLAGEEPDAADPELLLNYSLTAKQFWDAGRSFESVGSEGFARYAYSEAASLGDADMKKKAEAALKKLPLK